MRYFRLRGEGYYVPGEDWGGDPTLWLEVNESGDAEREMQVYPNGNVLRYDSTHPEDEYGALSLMVMSPGWRDDEEWFAAYEITNEEFEEQWRTESRFIRPT